MLETTISKTLIIMINSKTRMYTHWLIYLVCMNIRYHFSSSERQNNFFWKQCFSSVGKFIVGIFIFNATYSDVTLHFIYL